MKKADIIAQCEEFGEFYLYYEKLRSTADSKPSHRNKDVTYLQGTVEFLPEQDKYLAARMKREKIRPAGENHILVFSRTNDYFRYIPVDKVRKIISLNAGLNLATPVKLGIAS